MSKDHPIRFFAINFFLFLGAITLIVDVLKLTGIPIRASFYFFFRYVWAFLMTCCIWYLNKRKKKLKDKHH